MPKTKVWENSSDKGSIRREGQHKVGNSYICVCKGITELHLKIRINLFPCALDSKGTWHLSYPYRTTMCNKN